MSFQPIHRKEKKLNYMQINYERNKQRKKYLYLRGHISFSFLYDLIVMIV